MDMGDELKFSAAASECGAPPSSECSNSTSLERLKSEPKPDATESSVSAAGSIDLNAAEKASQKDNLAPLALISFFEPKRDGPASIAKTIKSRLLDNLSVSASLILIAFISAGAIYDHFRQSMLLAANAQDTERLTSKVNALEIRLDSTEVPRGREEAIDLRKALDQMKAEFAATRAFNADLTQLAARFDHLERDDTARLDKLNERIDRDLSSRFADILARLDKLEKKAVSQAAGAGAPSPAKPPLLQARGDVIYPNETTGSIEKPRQLLRGYSIADVRDGYALIDSRNGSQPVAPGDFIPGAGRVLRIERRGHEWAVITSGGVISSEPIQY